jgi:L1 cell adhesion molecule like protein
LIHSTIRIQSDFEDGKGEDGTQVSFEEWDCDTERNDEYEDFITDEASSVVEDDDIAESLTDEEISQMIHEVDSYKRLRNRGSNLSGSWKGFKIVGDNLDKNYQRTFQRINFQTISHHYFHSFAVLDRVNLSQASDEPRSHVIDINLLLPNEDDTLQLKNRMKVVVSRYMYILLIFSIF